MEKAPVVLFTASWCGYCKKARQYFIANQIPFKEVDIERSIVGYQEYKKLGGRGVPLFKIGDHVIQGYDRTTINSALADIGITPKS